MVTRRRALGLVGAFTGGLALNVAKVTAIDQTPVSSRVVFEYKRTGARALRMALYTPAEPNGQAILVLPGGGWEVGGLDETGAATSLDYSGYLAAMGYTVAECEYSFSYESQWPSQLEDVMDAFATLRNYVGNQMPISVFGQSAGGQLAMILAAKVKANAVVSLYGPTLSMLNPKAITGAVGRLVGDGNYSDACPLSHVAPGYPRTLLIHGGADSLVPPEDAIAMLAKLQGIKTPVSLHFFDGKGHGFDLDACFFEEEMRLVRIFLESKGSQSICA